MTEQHKTLSEKFLTNTFWLYLLSYIIAPIGYIIKIILTGELSVEEIGIIYGIISLVTLIGAFNDFGITESLKYFIPRFLNEGNYGKIKNILFYSISIQTISSTIIASLLYIFSNNIAVGYFHNVEAVQTIQIFCIFFIGINFFQIITTFFLAIQNTYYSKIIDLIRLVSSLLFTFLLIFLNKTSLEYFSYMWIVGLGFGLIAGISIFYNKFYKVYLKKIPISFDKKLFKTVIKYALLVFMGAQAATILSQIDMQMIIYLLGTKEVGLYTVYLSIIGIPFLLLGPIFALLMPVFSDLHSKNKIDGIKKIKGLLSNNFIVIGFTFNALFFIFAHVITFILFGENYKISGNILQYSILFLIFNFLLQINFNILAGIGKVTARVKIISIAIIINFTLNLIFLKTIGVEGAALATGIGWIIIWGMSEIYLGKKYFINYDIKFLTKNLFFIGFFSVFAYYGVLPIFEGIGRGLSILYMIIFSLLWFGLFGILNGDKVKNFTLEIKKLRKGK
ncbi:oligosaccharide flippase family protein [Candidatus Gracilibacteria bacterium 28_42_T64]|nr:oligosaccharide flippase family protein [Candidatus Gracilibacteria bacterium 28_42_T64]